MGFNVVFLFCVFWRLVAFGLGRARRPYLPMWFWTGLDWIGWREREARSPARTNRPERNGVYLSRWRSRLASQAPALHFAFFEPS